MNASPFLVGAEDDKSSPSTPSPDETTLSPQWQELLDALSSLKKQGAREESEQAHGEDGTTTSAVSLSTEEQMKTQAKRGQDQDLLEYSLRRRPPSGRRSVWK